MPTLGERIVETIEGYLAGTASYSDLCMVIWGEAMDVDLHHPDRDLWGKTALCMSEYDRNDLTDDLLRRELSDIIKNVPSRDPKPA